MSTSDIARLRARQILDSRGRPTVEVDVELAGGATGRAAVPSGASTGAAEAHELRDGDPARYRGRGVLRAVAHVNGEIAAALIGCDATAQRSLDDRLRELDGTTNLHRLGANAILGVSMAVCRAAALATKVSVHRYLAELAGNTPMTLPLPMVNILSGGLHAGCGMDVQDFLVVPIGARSMVEAIEFAARVRDAATEVCAQRGLPTLLADEGGLSPGLETSRAALELMMECFAHAGLQPGVDVAIAIDVAATTLQSSAGEYTLAREGRRCSSTEMISMVVSWLSEFPVVSVEDPLGEEDWLAWQRLTRTVGTRTQLIGDDLFATNAARLARGIAEDSANAVLVKVNQNCTVSGTLDVMLAARRAGYATIVSARSGETEDTFIANLAVGTGAGQIKIGSLRSSERLAKYNELLRIEEASGAPFAGKAALAPRR